VEQQAENQLTLGAVLDDMILLLPRGDLRAVGPNGCLANAAVTMPLTAKEACRTLFGPSQRKWIALMKEDARYGAHEARLCRRVHHCGTHRRGRSMMVRTEYDAVSPREDGGYFNDSSS